MTTEIVLDLETLGTKPGCVILSIGAVAACGDLRSDFYCAIDLQDCLTLGMTVDRETQQWWMRRDAEVLKEAFSGKRSLRGALTDFAAWVGSVESRPELRIYGKGPSFDCVILGAAYDLMGLERPWKFWEERCIRTAVTEAALLLECPEKELHVASHMPHHALWDARAEMDTLLRARERVAGRTAANVPFQI